jgi:hypothetical protein
VYADRTGPPAFLGVQVRVLHRVDVDRIAVALDASPAWVSLIGSAVEAEGIAFFGVLADREVLVGLHAVWTSAPVNLEIGSSRLVDFTLFPRPVQKV